jgi:hypothetical protein
MTSFKEALLDELKTHTATPQPLGTAVSQRWPRWRVLVAAGGAAAAASVTAAIALNSFTAAPAYAVAKNPDGSVSITWKDLADSTAATRDLRKAGVRAQVIKLSDPGTCPAPAKSGAPWQSHVDKDLGNGVLRFFAPDLGSRYNQTLDWLDFGQTTERKIIFYPTKIPADATVFIVQDKSPKGMGIIGTGLVDSPAPTCWERTR